MNCENFETFEDIIKENKEEIVRQTLANTSSLCSGVAQIGIEDGKLYFGGLSTNEVENPANKVIEFYRIDRGFNAEDYLDCLNCDRLYDCDNNYSEEQLDECVVDSLMEEFDYSFDDIMSHLYNEIQEWGYDMV